MKWFLKLKHWQYFLLLTVIPILGTLVWVGIHVSEVFNGGQIDIKSLTIGSSLIAIIPLVFSYGWYYSVVHVLQRALPEHLRSRTTLFHLLHSLLYLIIIGLVLWISFYMIPELVNNAEASDKIPQVLPIYIIGVLGISFFSTIISFYMYYFLAKTIKTAEEKKEVRFEAYILEFILLWFFIVGVWIIQPQLNKLVKEIEERGSLYNENTEELT